MAGHEDWLFEIAEEMDTEDGRLWVAGVGEDGVMAFTADGIDNVIDLIEIQSARPGRMEDRRKALATAMARKTEEPNDG